MALMENKRIRRFFTKYDVQDTPYHGVVMNPVDAVDRLSYVDTTQQIVRMMQAGANLRMRNNQGYQSEDFNAPAMPVYTPDLADAQRRVKTFTDNLKENARIRSLEFERSQREKLAKEPEVKADPEGSALKN